jgi:hypothetical protein
MHVCGWVCVCVCVLCMYLWIYPSFKQELDTCRVAP